MKLSTSSLVTRPPLPVEGTLLISMFSFLARCLTAGVDKALDWVEESELPGGAVPTLSIEFACSLGAALAGSWWEPRAAATSSSAPVSIFRRMWPTGAMSSFAKLISVTLPDAVEGILATSLSVKTSHRS